MDAAAAEVAEKLVRSARAGGADEQLLFNPTEGRIDLGEGGVGPRADPPESVDGDSLHPSDLVSLLDPVVPQKLQEP